MPPTNTVNQTSCEENRKEIYKDINKNAQEIASMKGAHRLAVIVSPIIVSIILTLGGIAFASYIKSELLQMKMEIKDSQRNLEKPLN